MEYTLTIFMNLFLKNRNVDKSDIKKINYTNNEKKRHRLYLSSAFFVIICTVDKSVRKGMIQCKEQSAWL